MNGNVLELIPKEKQTSKVCLGAVKQNGLALKFVPPAKKTAALCREAIGNNALALEFVPKRHKTEKICGDAINADWRAIQFVQQPEYDVGSAVLFLERILCSENSGDEKAICNIVRNWKNDLLLDGGIIRLLRKLKVCAFTLKAYLKDMKVFLAREKIKYSKEIEETDFSSFE